MRARNARRWTCFRLLGATCGLAACAGSPPERPPVTLLVRTAESRTEIATLLTETFASEFCDQVRDRFLPVALTAEGAPARGDEPVGGRLWVRTCRTQSYPSGPGTYGGPEVAVYLDGVGWAWAEGSKGFIWSYGTAAYAYFSGAGTVVGTVDAAFDPVGKLETIQFRPTSVPYLNTAGTNRLEAHGNAVATVGSVVLLGLPFLLADKIDDAANDTVRDLIAQAFGRQIGSGFVITFDVARKQWDRVVLGQLPPLHPFSDGVRWLVNEQQVMHSPGGVNVNGPFQPTRAAGVDFQVVSGSIRYRAECDRDVVAWFEPVARGSAPTLPSPQHAQTGVLSEGARVTRTVAASCPWYLITEPVGDADATVNVRVRADSSGYPVAGP